MDTERPHRTTTSSNSSTSELFICFTSRLSSSTSMKLSSKSILSPGRNRDPPQISLQSSLSRRLRNNGSMKGGQASPMFPTTGGKRRGCGFENPEPSSPKVTCIGQVRVKTKKQGKKMRTRSKRRGEALSFRKTEQSFQAGPTNPDLNRQNSTQSFQYQNHHQNLQQECLRHRNQRWVHLPLTICEALRAFGAEFSCLFPCRSSCNSSEREKEEKVTERSNGCGAAFGRWLVAMQEGDAKGRTEIQLVMEEEEDRTEVVAERSYHRRHVFEDIDIDVAEGKKNEEFLGEEEEKARVSICIPPKNALLLMRCRSDPVKMAALANRFWESPVKKFEDEDGDEGDEENRDEEEQEETAETEEVSEEVEQIELQKDGEVQGKIEENVVCETEKVAEFVLNEEEHVISEAAEAKPEMEGGEMEMESRTNTEINEAVEINQEKQGVIAEDEDNENGGVNSNSNQQDENFSVVSSPEVDEDLDEPESEEVQPSLLHEDEEYKLKEKENDERSELPPRPSFSVSSEPENIEAEIITETTAVMDEISAEGSTEEEEKQTSERPSESEEETLTTHDRSDPKAQISDPESKERENGSKSERDRGSSGLPECLLLMMCEPKLSMEVSKETWVCSTDFIRWLPEKPVRKMTCSDGGDAEPKKRVSVDSKPPLAPAPSMLQPPRSSCSFPASAAPISMANMIEQKLVGSNACEPFVLTRCKSEPMRSSAKLAAEACFWKNRKVEPHPPARLGVGAAGVGF